MKSLVYLRSIIKFLISIIAILVYILLALLLHLFLFMLPQLKVRTLSQLNKWLTKFLRFVLCIKIIIEGKEFIPKENNLFIFSNHLTYLDGIIIGSLFPVIFVSKKEVKSWPLFGQMAFLGATIFIDRKRKDKSPDYVQQISETIKSKTNVLIFPEGTSTDGTKLLPFQTVFFNPPIITKSLILPIAIKYIKIENERVSINNRDMVYWYGKMTFFKHLWNFLSLRGIVVRVKISPPIDGSKFSEDSSGRKALSRVCYEQISKILTNKTCRISSFLFLAKQQFSWYNLITEKILKERR